METIAMVVVGGFVLFMIITYAVKLAVKEALYEFKEDIVKEFNLRSTGKDSRDDD